MSEIPPYRPDPPGEGSPVRDNRVPDERVADHLPAYGTDFGLADLPEPSWVPPKAAPGPTGGFEARVPHAPAESRGTSRGAAQAGGVSGLRVRGVRVQAWHVVAVVVGLLIPLGFWAAADMVDDLDPLAAPVIRVTPYRPGVIRTFPVPQVPTITRPTGNRSPSVQFPAPTKSLPTRPAMTVPPLVAVPAIPVTPVPTGAGSIRFEAHAQNGGRVEVSLSDATHQRHDFRVQAAPLAFEVPVSPTASSYDYFSLRVHTADTASSGGGAVTCRILVDGVVVTSQQGRSTATCYISPYYDVLRR